MVFELQCIFIKVKFLHYNFFLGSQKDLTYNVACIQLFSANAMDVFIKLTQKINEFLQRPWLQGQPFTSGHCYYVVSIVLPLLACVNRLLAGMYEGAVGIHPLLLSSQNLALVDSMLMKTRLNNVVLLTLYLSFRLVLSLFIS